MENFSQIRRTVLSFLSSLRNSVHRQPAIRSPIGDPARERWMQSLLLIEEARIRFDSGVRFRNRPTDRDWLILKRELLSGLTEIRLQLISMHDESVFRFRGTPLLARDISELDPELPAVFKTDDIYISVIEAIDVFASYLSSREWSETKTDNISFEDLAKIVPNQQLAPVQFEVVGQKITVAHRGASVATGFSPSAEAALEHIRSAGDTLLKELECSNCDRRLLQTVSELHEQVIINENIIKIGLSNLLCSQMAEAAKAEMPDSIGAMLASYNSSVALYAGQFEEWNQFTQVASSIDIDDEDIIDLDLTASLIIEELKKNPDIADSEVPKTIQYIRNFLSFPKKYSKRAAFSVVRTLENLISVIVRYGIKFMTKTADEVVEKGAVLTSKVILAWFSIALIGAGGISAISAETGSVWVRQVVDVVQKQIDKVS